MAESYPIREVMHDCAEAWNDQSEPISPFLAAAQFSGELKRRSLSYDTYLQTIITGGGHVHDPDITAQEAVDRNVRNGLAVAEMLFDEQIIDPAASLEAASLPTINGWKPDDYMTLWPLLIAKPDFSNMSRDRLKYLEGQFQHKIWERVNFGGLDMALYRDRTIDKSLRLRHYNLHVNVMHEMLAMNKDRVSINPIHRIVGLLGIEESVGSTAEKFYATNLGIRAYQAVMARVQPLSPEELSNAELGSDIRRLRDLGVRALAGAPLQQLILVEDRSATNWDIADAKPQA